MASASLKYNRSLTGKRKFKNAKDLILKTSGKTKLEFKEVSSLELAKIKRKIRLDARKRVQRTIIAYISAVIITVLIIVYLVY
ncbi:hypothetical protein [Pontimicrobium aquaticum]|uniref:Uncharacterized protein n=1 Tax=Pontimicrobium aquaticum TaxID=2565367 RepID=A0A4V5LQ43_9FLAO|nr:hypothetical protein [Pontimicrobium aquaticum]TJY33889.1 hypothetical protein E5167_11225 [Pontimicrobium aquaticum]